MRAAALVCYCGGEECEERSQGARRECISQVGSQAEDAMDQEDNEWAMGTWPHDWENLQKLSVSLIVRLWEAPWSRRSRFQPGLL